ncbi:MAG: Ig-like domain-containing protein [Vicinamibacterales bacterium]
MPRVFIALTLIATVSADHAAEACRYVPYDHKPWTPNTKIVWEFQGPGFTSQQMTCFGQGLAKWAVVNGYTFESSSEHGLTPNLVIHDAATPLDGKYAQWIATSTDIDNFFSSGEILLHQEWATLSQCEQWKNVGMHEFGHAVGMNDVEGGLPWSETIMTDTDNSNLAQPWNPTPCDLQNAVTAIKVNPGGFDGTTSCGTNGYADNSGCCAEYNYLSQTPTNVLPYGHILGPINGSVYPVGSSGQVRVDVVDVDGHVQSVDWYTNGAYALTSNSPPFSAPYGNAPAGNYTLQARVFDTTGDSTWTDPIGITVGTFYTPDTLEPGGKLWPGWSYAAANGAYYLQFQMDGNLVLYTAAGQPLAATGTLGPPAFVEMGLDGNLVVRLFPDNPQVAWQTFTQGNFGSGMRVLGSGKVAIVRQDGSIVWQAP